MYMSKHLVLGLCLMLLPQFAQAGWDEFVGSIKKTIQERIDRNSRSALSEENIAEGLKHALYQSIKVSAKQLGAENGFLADTTVKIPLPEHLKQVEKTLRATGQEKLVHEFIDAMNHVAEKSSSRSVVILVDAVQAMVITDPVKLLNGQADAVTQYYKQSSADQLRLLIKPIIHKSTNKLGLDARYETLMKQAGSLSASQQINEIESNGFNLNDYISRKTLDGLFTKMLLEEKVIRDNPIARRTNLLKDVFSSLEK